LAIDFVTFISTNNTITNPLKYQQSPSINHQKSINQPPKIHQSTTKNPSINHQKSINQPQTLSPGFIANK
jgi:hypothetical protein